jgi:cell division protein FtsZ
MNEVFIPKNWDENLSHMIKVMGVGGGGNNAVQNMYNKGIKGVDFIICNTDAQVLNKSTVPNKIQIGVKLTGGLGAGCNPEKGEKAALENLEDIKDALSKNNTKMVFIAAGLGGGTGTGATPVIAKEAKEMGLLTVAIVTLPFKDEGDEPYSRALTGLQKLRGHVDSLLIINSQKLYDIYPDLSVFEAFPRADDIVATAAKSIAELITIEGYINVDFADVKMVMENSDMALMGLGRASGENRVQKATEQALTSPLLNNSDISGAKNILVNISSGMKNPLKMSELGELMRQINEASGGKANFKRGVTKDESLDLDSSDAEIAVTIVATGFSMSNSFPDIDDDVNIVPNPVSDNIIVHVLDSSDSCCNEGNRIELSNKQTPYTIDLTEMDETAGIPEITTISTQTANPSVQQHAVSQPGPSNPSNTAANVGAVNTIWSAKDIDAMEKTPAYERVNTKIVIGTTAMGDACQHRLDESGGVHTLGENNSYLDRDVD